MPNAKRKIVPSLGAQSAGRNISDRFRQCLPNLPESTADTISLIVEVETHVTAIAQALRESLRINQDICGIFKVNLSPEWKRLLKIATLVLKLHDGEITSEEYAKSLEQMNAQ